MRIKEGIKEDKRKLRTFTNGSKYVCILKYWISEDVKEVKIAKAEAVEVIPPNAIIIIPIEVKNEG